MHFTYDGGLYPLNSSTDDFHVEDSHCTPKLVKNQSMSVMNIYYLITLLIIIKKIRSIVINNWPVSFKWVNRYFKSKIFIFYAANWSTIFFRIDFTIFQGQTWFWCNVIWLLFYKKIRLQCLVGFYGIHCYVSLIES